MSKAISRALLLTLTLAACNRSPEEAIPGQNAQQLDASAGRTDGGEAHEPNLKRDAAFPGPVSKDGGDFSNGTFSNDSGLWSDAGPWLTSDVWVPLVDRDLWELDTAANDPLSELRTGQVVCEGSAFYPELDGIELETKHCNYASLSQPTLAAVRRGSDIELTLWWTTLASKAPAVGYLALLVEATVIWEEHVDIPAPASARTLVFPLPVDIKPGARIRFHIHNHGYNTWQLASIKGRAQR